MRAGPKLACSYARTMLFLASLVVVASFVEPPRPPGGLEFRPAIVVDDPHDPVKAPMRPDPVPASPQSVGSGGSGWLLVLPPVLLAVVLVLLSAWYMRGGVTEEERRAALRVVRERQALDAQQASQGDTDHDTHTDAAHWHEHIPPQAVCPSPASAWSVCVPLTSVEELCAWAPPCLTGAHCLPHHPATVPYRAPPANVLHEQTRRGRLLVCHDFKGGYHPYETPSYPSLRPFHTNDEENKAQYKDGAYRLSQWAMVDGFIYFAHSLVSLPPPQWVSAAHLSGAKAIGTFITEWGEGHDKCKALFQDKHSAEKAALQLARMAVYHRLEGWLINIENKIDWAGGVEAIVHFLSTLTSQLRTLMGPHSVVLWYDSVTADTGELQWQNGLTSRNEAFFSACDGLFVNYVWDLDKLAASAARAMTQSRAGRRWDVYMGIDCFGRNTFGGGGWQCNTALEAIRNAGLSAALFAPGWVWENEVAPYIKTQDSNTPEQQEPEAKEGEADKEKESEVATKALACYVEWGEVESAFQCKQRDFWASLAQVWPAKPWPPCVVSFSRPLLTNFSCGAGTRLYGPSGPYPLSPTHDPHTNNTPWCSVGLQDVLPLPLTLCAPSPSTIDLRLCSTHAYRGSSCLCVSACLPGGSARVSSVPLFSLCPQPTLMQALELHIAYKLPHNHSLASEGEGEDDLYVEVLLQGAPSSSSQASATTVLVLRGHPKDQDTATTTKKGNLRGSGGECWESRRVGSAKDGDTALLFYAPSAQYTDPLPDPCAPSSPLPTAAHTLQVLEGAVQSAVKAGASYEEAASSLKGSTDSLYEAQDRLTSIPWTHRVWRLRDLALVGRTLHSVRLCCVKKKGPSGGAPCPYFRAYVGELMLAHVPKAWASATPVTSLLPSLHCTHLSLTPMQGPGLQGLLQWEWAELDMPIPAPEDGTLQAQDAVRHVDVLLLVPKETEGDGAVWLGRSLTSSFMVDTAHWPLSDIGRGGKEAGTVELRLVIQPTDLWGNTLPLASCPTLVLTTPTPTADT